MPNERQASKVLYDELKKRRNQGETNRIIRNGKIIKRQRSSAPHIMTKFGEGAYNLQSISAIPGEKGLRGETTTSGAFDSS